MRPELALFSVCLVLASARGAQAPADPPTTRVMVLGTYHFENPGLDVIKTDVADVLLPEQQAEIAEVVELLAAFKPSKIAVEAPLSDAARLDRAYAAFRSGAAQLGRNEIDQLGFRLAARFDHARVYPVDHAGEFPFEPVMAYATAHDPEFVKRVQGEMSRMQAEMQELQQTQTVRGILQRFNDPTFIAAGHALYMDMAAVGAGDGYAGADLLSAWYERNLRIYANLRRAAEPGDRVLLIIGAGHAAILRELIRSTARFELVEPAAFL